LELWLGDHEKLGYARELFLSIPSDANTRLLHVDSHGVVPCEREGVSCNDDVFVEWLHALCASNGQICDKCQILVIFHKKI